MSAKTNQAQSKEKTANTGRKKQAGTRPPAKKKGAKSKPIDKDSTRNYMSAMPSPAPIQQVSAAIKIAVEPCVEGVMTIPIPSIMYALQLGALNTQANPIYHAYVYMINDLVSLMGGNTGAASRLRYLNYVYPSLIGKTVPFARIGSINYNWTDLTNINPVPQIVCRGQKTSMYVLNNMSVYVPPSSPTDKESYDAYVRAMASVFTNLQSNTYFERNVTLDGDFKNDTSAFSRIAPYHGSGVSPCFGWWATSESEVPFKNPGLGLSLYVPSQNRSSRFIQPSSCDPCVNYNIGLLNIPLSLYKSAYPIVLKCIDFDEIFYAFQWWLRLLGQTGSQGNTMGTVFNPTDFQYDTTFPHLEAFGYNYYAVAFRQVLLKQFFSLGNTLAQFCRPINSLNSWEPFRIGTNSAPLGPWAPIIFPNVLNENLKMLLPGVYSQAKGDKLRREKNGSIIIPVLGRYTVNRLPQVPLFGQVPNPQDLNAAVPWTELPFGGTAEPGLNLIECSLNSNLFDANDGVYTQAVGFLNTYIARLKQFSAPTEFCGGAPPVKSRLCLTTRYVKFFPVDQEIKSTPAVEYLVDRNKLPGFKRDQKGKIIYAPNNSSLSNERDVGVSSYFPLSNDLRTLMNNLILPIIEVDEGTNQDVSVEQMQTETREVYASVAERTNDELLLSPSRQVQLQGLASMMATGLAATKGDTLSNYVEALALKGGGSFFGDIFGTISSVAGGVSHVIGALGI